MKLEFLLSYLPTAVRKFVTSNVKAQPLYIVFRDAREEYVRCDLSFFSKLQHLCILSDVITSEH